MSRTELQKLDQSKIEDFRNMINLAKSSAKQDKSYLNDELDRIQKIADSCLSPLSYDETEIVMNMIWRARRYNKAGVPNE